MLTLCGFSFKNQQLGAVILSLNVLRQILANEAKLLAQRHLKEGPSVRQLAQY